MNKIITERPNGMSYEEYRKVRKQQTDQLRRRKKHGDLVYKAVELVKGNTDADVMRKFTYPPAMKAFDGNGNVVYKPMKNAIRS